MLILKEKLFLALKSLYRKIRYWRWLFSAQKKGEILTPSAKSKSSILFLLPEAGISLYIKILVMLASQFKLLGYRVYFARCFNIFERCVFMDSESLSINATPKEKKLLCTYCFRTFEKHVASKGFEFVDLRHFINEEDRLEIKKIIDKNPDGVFDVSFEGINFGGVLEYNLFLYLKKSDLTNLSETELKLWQQNLSSLYLGYLAVKRLIESFNTSHVVMCDEYSLNSIVKDLSIKFGVSQVNVSLPFHKDVDVTKLRILRKDSLSEYFDAIRRWPELKELGLMKSQIKEAVDDLIVRMSKKGTYTYSPGKGENTNIWETLHLDKKKKTIVAYPSSPDEIDSILSLQRTRGLPLETPNDAFKDQFEWLDELIGYVENSDEFQLIVRLHPRIAPNHREKWGCSVLDEFLNRYSSDYKNVKIIWPQDKISSFDLAEIADVVTVSWSSMGIFMARLGVPVISGLKLFLPVPNDIFHVFCPTQEQYFNSLKLLSNSPPIIANLKYAYRWYNLMYLGYCIELEDVIDENLNVTNKLSKNAAVLEKAIVNADDVLAINYNFLQENQNQANDENESAALRTQLFRLIHYFMTNQDNLGKSEITMVNISVNTQYDDILNMKVNHVLILNKNQIEYHFNSEIYYKYSPMISRMASFAKLLTFELEEEIKEIVSSSSVVEC